MQQSGGASHGADGSMANAAFDSAIQRSRHCSVLHHHVQPAHNLRSQETVQPLHNTAWGKQCPCLLYFCQLVSKQSERSAHADALQQQGLVWLHIAALWQYRLVEEQTV